MLAFLRMPELKFLRTETTAEEIPGGLPTFGSEATPIQSDPLTGRRGAHRNSWDAYAAWYLGNTRASKESRAMSGGRLYLFGEPEEEVASRQAKLANTEPALSSGERANRARLQLLSRKYVVGSLSTEERARFELVTERVRALLPSVSLNDFRLLDELEERHNARKATSDALYANLKLD